MRSLIRYFLLASYSPLGRSGYEISAKSTWRAVSGTFSPSKMKISLPASEKFLISKVALMSLSRSLHREFLIYTILYFLPHSLQQLTFVELASFVFVDLLIKVPHFYDKKLYFCQLWRYGRTRSRLREEHAMNGVCLLKQLMLMNVLCHKSRLFLNSTRTCKFVEPNEWVDGIRIRWRRNVRK